MLGPSCILGCRYDLAFKLSPICLYLLTPLSPEHVVTHLCDCGMRYALCGLDAPGQS